MKTWNLDAIEGALSDAAIDPKAWGRALDVVSAQTNAFGCILVPVAGNHLPNVPISDRMGQSLETYFREGWHLRDERNRGAAIMKRTGVVDDLAIHTLEEINQHPYYQEFLAPQGLKWFAGVKVTCGDDLWCLSIQRTTQQEPFSSEEKQKLAQLSQRLSSVAATCRALGYAATNAALDAFEVSETAVLLFDRLGRVNRVNQSAESLLDRDVNISGNRLVVAHRESARLLDLALKKLLWSREASLSVPVALTRYGRRPLIAYLMKLSSLAANAFADCQALMVLIDPDKRWRPPEIALQTAFGLTPAEAKLAAKISAGVRLETIATEHGIARETGRNQLKSIFAKTGVHSQAELAASCGSTVTRTMGLVNPAS
jgi:DNA-binding CsgD family transcriptional regulator